MKIRFLIFGLILEILLLGCHSQPSDLDSSYNREVTREAYQQINEYHSDKKPIKNGVKVVYFHAADQPPLPYWEERLTRTLHDISNFYKEEFHRYGIEIEGVPFEEGEEGIIFHLVRGNLSARDYGIRSGRKIENEIDHKTKGQIDFSKDHVLIINGLCYRQEDGTYVFHSPYYGRGSSTNGICHVADCELLDSKLLTDTVQTMMFSEMMVKNKTCGVAEFNSWYVGGIAHEMGHIFGLSHDYGHPDEFDSLTISLMGQYGSRHYRDYLWNGKPSSHFSEASVLQLMNHPVFTQSEKPKSIDTDANQQVVKIENQTNRLVLKSTVNFDKQPYGTVALMHSSSQSEYLNRSFCNVVSSDDTVSIELSRFSEGNYVLKLLYLFPNGTVGQLIKEVVIDNAGHANVQDFITNGRVDVKRLYNKLQSMEKTSSVKTKLKILEGILTPPEEIDPKKYAGDTLVLSDAKWKSASVGWEKVARNYFTKETEHMFFMKLQGQLYSKGLYAHSPSSYVFGLDEKWKEFSAIVGLRDYAHKQGSARFTLIGDGKVLYQSSALRVNQIDKVSVNISDVKVLELRTEGTEGHNHNSWAIWVNPTVNR